MIATTAYGDKINVPADVMASRGIFKWKEKDDCYRCFGAGYFPTRAHGACFRCGGEKKEWVARKAYSDEAYAKLAARREKIASKKLAESHARDMARNAVLMPRYGLSYEQLADIAAWLVSSPVIWDILRKASLPLSEAQWGVTDGWIKRFEEWAATEPAPKLSLPEGVRVKLEAKLVHAKYVESSFGNTLKGMFLIVQGGAEAKIWMTVPAGFGDTGETKTISVSLSASGDEGFYYGSRAKVVK